MRSVCVCLSESGHDRKPVKTAELIELSFVADSDGYGWAQRTIIRWGRDPHGTGQLWRLSAAH